MVYILGSVGIIRILRLLGNLSIRGVVLLISICWFGLLLARRLVRTFFLVLFWLGSGSEVAKLPLKVLVGEAILGVG
jgi:hypothetical protein